MYYKTVNCYVLIFPSSFQSFKPFLCFPILLMTQSNNLEFPQSTLAQISMYSCPTVLSHIILSLLLLVIVPACFLCPLSCLPCSHCYYCLFPLYIVHVFGRITLAIISSNIKYSSCLTLVLSLVLFPYVLVGLWLSLVLQK